MQAAIKTSGSVDSIAEVVDMKTEPKIAILQKKGGNRSTFGIIKALLLAMNVNLHIDNSLTEANINNIAQMLTSNSELRWWLTLADIDLLCRQIVQGRFGKFYGHFSEQEFNDCLTRYCNERTELHRQANDKTIDVGDPVMLEEMGYKVDKHGNINMLEEVGYKVGKKGNIIVPEERQGVAIKKPTRYLYGAKGNITGENPAYWASVRHHDEKTTEELEQINLFNQRLQRAHELQNENNEISFVSAFAKAEIEIKQ
ncbi:MAG: hypothetical protein K6F72_00250 [Bacteroidales bacterium]|nr:hypothetical protein [Bacteroidales bacterium]